MKTIRTRFAPSPTGPLHIGGIRTALYSYLFAKKHGGEFLFRLEDTDYKRFVPATEEYILESFRWLGIEFDNVSDQLPGYPIQSERSAIYSRYIKDLIVDGHLYCAMDSPEDLEKMRESGLTYNYETRKSMNNNLAWEAPKEDPDFYSESWVEKWMFTRPGQEAGDWVLRIKMPEGSDLDDKVVWKSSNRLPTYHLASVIDDYLMGITHVIRGNEWIPSTPLHKYLYECLHWEAPEFIHLPLITHNGQKLSKRNADKHGIPVNPILWNENELNFRDSGYSPEALINILALLGWNPGTEQEIFSLDELVENFSLDRIGSSSHSEFDEKKAAWINGQHLRSKSSKDLRIDLVRYLATQRAIESPGFDHYTNDYKEKALATIQERCNFPSDLWKEAKFFFVRPVEYDDRVMKKFWDDDKGKVIWSINSSLSQTQDFSPSNIELILIENIGLTGKFKKKDIFPLLRLALIGTNTGPHLGDVISILGRGEAITRIANFMKL